MSSVLQNKVAIVTGSGKGIGRSIALAMAKEGARVVTNSRKPGMAGGDAGTVAKEINEAGGQAEPFFGDVSGFDVAGLLVKTAVKRFGRVDILVNNAGFHNRVDPWEMTEEDWDMVVNTVLKGTFNCSRHAIPLMKDQRWGRIINCTSGSWISAFKGCHYAAAKAGVVGFTRALAADLGGYGITCNAYHPFALTREDHRSGAPEKVFKKRLEMGAITQEEYQYLAQRPGPEGIGPMIAYLATDAAANINGKVFYASGGIFALYSEPVKKKTIIKEKGLWTVAELIEQVPKTLLARELEKE